jgi:tripartite-type tricarboxylate transporter receptor subunit TctC
MKLKTTFTVIALAACFVGAQAQAQSWPAKQMRIVVPAPAGSAPDIAARAIADKLGVSWGMQPIIDNKPGAGCGIAMDAVRTAPADGYTVVLAQAACVVVSPLTFKTFKSDIDRDFAAISIVGITPMLIVANNAAPAKNLSEVVSQAKAAPDKITMGNPARTSIPHLAAELIAQQTGAKLFQVSFGSSGQATTAAVAGDVMYGLDGVAAMQPMVKAGKLRAIAVTSDRVLPGLEAYPLAKEVVPGLEVFGWFALMAPKATPTNVLSKINDDINKALTQPDVIAQFAGFGTYPRPGSLQEATNFIKKEQAQWAKVIKDARIQAE